MNQFQNEYLQYQKTRKSFWDSVNSLDRDNQSLLSNYYQSLLSAIYQNIIPKNSRVLELGCGSGNLLSSLHPSYGLGVDFSSSAIDKASILHPHLNFQVSDAHDFSLKNQNFDYIKI